MARSFSHRRRVSLRIVNLQRQGGDFKDSPRRTAKFFFANAGWAYCVRPRDRNGAVGVRIWFTEGGSMVASSLERLGRCSASYGSPSGSRGRSASTSHRRDDPRASAGYPPPPRFHQGTLIGFGNRILESATVFPPGKACPLGFSRKGAKPPSRKGMQIMSVSRCGQNTT